MTQWGNFWLVEDGGAAELLLAGVPTLTSARYRTPAQASQGSASHSMTTSPRSSPHAPWRPPRAASGRGDAVK
jgi:hypothetical protein